MDAAEFKVRGQEMVEYICNYLEDVGSRRVTSTVEPGYLRPLLPKEAPQEPEDWDQILADVDSKIMPGITHWQHPRFHAYFPSGNSYPSILGDMLSDAIGCIGFSWAASPACTELETIVTDWFGKALGLPDDFLSQGSGGGVIQSSASECVLVSMLAARAHAIRQLRRAEQPKSPASPCPSDTDDDGLLDNEAAGEETATDSTYLPRLVAYCSRESHSCVEKAARIALVRLRILEPDEHSALRGATLAKAMEADVRRGLVPFFVSTTLGTTSCCSFDNLTEIGPVVRRHPDVWLHVDGAYAGNGFICPELRVHMQGIQYADSFNTNPNKWLLTSFDCSCLWVRDRLRLTSGLIVDPLYLQHSNMDETIDYRHWGIPLSRRFRALKLFFVLRRYGIAGLQRYVRNHIKLAKSFEALVRDDHRFEVCNDVRLGLVCFRLRGPDRMNQQLLAALNESGKLHMIPSMVRGRYVIRFCVVAEHATEADIEHAWEVISEHATDLLDEVPLSPVARKTPRTPTELAEKLSLTRTLSRRHSFVRSVSRVQYQRSLSRTSLYDGATPITVPEDEAGDDLSLSLSLGSSDSVVGSPCSSGFGGFGHGHGLAGLNLGNSFHCSTPTICEEDPLGLVLDQQRQKQQQQQQHQPQENGDQAERAAALPPPAAPTPASAMAKKAFSTGLLGRTPVKNA
ncbi:aromatic-L-amino-acid decarboxylase-like [Thrips palmi]|uniref:Aromatic-L-amino-acid decarboxylase-like n=1 Tax=Thrips palmi TaxID=161013 RepID=A0A6P8ZS97_THRPL|nr:aromatic-L-amino-acid decarboxylase-like [Thrips palmi]XP_034248099.1 aromatic-L-amino-acid decarboxylase-like [Thrips palmi]